MFNPKFKRQSSDTLGAPCSLSIYGTSTESPRSNYDGRLALSPRYQSSASGLNGYLDTNRGSVTYGHSCNTSMDGVGLRLSYDIFEQAVLPSCTSISKSTVGQVVAYISQLDAFIDAQSDRKGSADVGVSITEAKDYTHSLNQSTCPMGVRLDLWLKFIKYQKSVCLTTLNRSQSASSILSSNGSPRRQTTDNYNNCGAATLSSTSIISEIEATALWGLFSSIVSNHHSNFHLSYTGLTDSDLSFCSACRRSDTSHMSIGDDDFEIDIRYFALLMLLQVRKSSSTSMTTNASNFGRQQQATPLVASQSSSQSLTNQPSVIGTQGASGGLGRSQCISSPAIHPSVAHVTSLSSPRASPKSCKLSPRHGTSLVQATFKILEHLNPSVFTRKQMPVIFGILARDYDSSRLQTDTWDADVDGFITRQQLKPLELIFELPLDNMRVKSSLDLVNNEKRLQSYNELFEFVSEGPSSSPDSYGRDDSVDAIHLKVATVMEYLTKALIENEELLAVQQRMPSTTRSVTSDTEPPRESGYHHIHVESLMRRTIIVPQDQGQGSSCRTRSNQPIISLSITDCTDCFIYVPFKCSFVQLTGCMECRVVIPAVEGITTLSNCSGVSVHVATSALKLANSYDSKLFVYCKTRPLLLGDTRTITLAPFNIISESHTSLMASADLSIEPKFIGLWSQPIVLSPLVMKTSCATLSQSTPTAISTSTPGQLSSTAEETIETSFLFLNPELFKPLVLPPNFCKVNSKESSTAEHVGGIDTAVENANLANIISKLKDESRQSPKLILPEVYAEAIRNRQACAGESLNYITSILDNISKIKGVCKEVTDGSPNISLIKDRFNNILQRSFFEWLLYSGKLRELNDIARLESEFRGSNAGLTSRRADKS